MATNCRYRARYPPQYFLSPLFYFFLSLSPPSPSFFFRLFSFHSLIYRVDNSSLSDIQWQLRNVAEERERRERGERREEREERREEREREGVEVVYYETGWPTCVYFRLPREGEGEEVEEKEEEKEWKMVFPISLNDRVYREHRVKFISSAVRPQPR